MKENRVFMYSVRACLHVREREREVREREAGGRWRKGVRDGAWEERREEIVFERFTIQCYFRD